MRANNETYTCKTCGKEFPCVDPASPHAGNYGVDKENNKHCPACCAEWEKADLLENRKGMLYLTYDNEDRNYQTSGFIYPKNGKLTNWHGLLSIPIRAIKIGKHNIAGRRFDVWFTWQGKEWHGVQYGDYTQICHIRQVKKAA